MGPKMESEKKPEERTAENLLNLKQELEDKNPEVNRSIEEKETLVSQVENLELDLNSTRIGSPIREESLKDLQKKRVEISSLREKLELAESEITRLSTMQKDAEEEKTSLSSKISQFEDDKKQAVNNIQKLEEKERELEKDELLMQIETLKQELANKNSEDKRSKEENKTLLLQIKDHILDLDSTHHQKLELEKQLKGKNQEISKSLTREETSEKESDKRASEKQEIVDTLLKEIDSIWNQKHKVEEELKNMTAKLEILEAKELMHLVTEIGKASEKSLRRLDDARRVIEIESSQEQMELLQSDKSQLEIQIKRNKKELEDYKKEVNTLFEKFPNIKVLQDKVAGISVKVTAEVLSNMKSGVDAFCREFEEGNGRLNSRVNEILNKIKMSEDELIEVEGKMKEKDEEVETLKEEKRQVIRQLCSSIEYYRERSNELEDELKEIRSAHQLLQHHFSYESQSSQAI